MHSGGHTGQLMTGVPCQVAWSGLACVLLPAAQQFMGGYQPLAGWCVSVRHGFSTPICCANLAHADHVWSHECRRVTLDDKRHRLLVSWVGHVVARM